MAYKKQSIAEDIVDITAMLPWWVGVGLAAISYLILSYIAGIEVEKPAGIGGMGEFAGKQIYIRISGVLQYGFPIIFSLGALGSVIIDYRKNKLYGNLKQKPKIQSLMAMRWQEFELLVGKYFEEKGFFVRQLAQPGPDGGVDLVAIKDGDKYLVQCKQWRSNKVGVQVVRELLGAIAAQGAVGGYVVTSGVFTDSARDFVQGRNIELIDGTNIVGSVGVDVSNEPAEAGQARQTQTQEPACPKCGASMKLRTARQGATAGDQFWGCPAYPACKGTRSL